MSAVQSICDRTIDLGGAGRINGFWHCFGVKHELVGWRMACNMLDASGTALLPINTNQGKLLVGHGDVTWETFRVEADRRDLIPCLNINLQTTAARAVAQAVRFRDLTGIDLLKLEVLSRDETTSNDYAVAQATELLVDEGFTVMPLISALSSAAADFDYDSGRVPVLRVMGSPIGSGLGILDPDDVAEICEETPVPVILDGGIGSVEHARQALKLGCAGFLVNSTLFTGDLSPAEWLRVYREALA